MSAITAPERIWAKVRGAMQSFPSLDSHVIGSFEARPDDAATEYVRADLVPSWNRDMSAAPRDGSRVMIATKDGYVSVTRTPLSEWHSDAERDAGQQFAHRYFRHDPIAWMPLPEQPDGGEDA